MSFFPYDCDALRCHPISAFLDPKQQITCSLTVRSAHKLCFLCTVCGAACMRAPKFARVQTMTCKIHSKPLHKKRHKYDGPIPPHVCRPIRAGILLKVKHGKLCDVVASLDPIKNAQDPLGLAAEYIESIAQYDRTCLADNCFWGDDSSVRRNGVRVPHKKPQKRHRVSQDNDLGVSHSDQPQTVSDVTTRSGLIGVSCTYYLRHCCFCYCLQGKWLQTM